MALHMIYVRMKLAAQPREPAMIRTLLPSTNPVAAVARPDHEFSSAMVSGMSAPPAATVSRIPYTTSPSPRNSAGMPANFVIRFLVGTRSPPVAQMPWFVTPIQQRVNLFPPASASPQFPYLASSATASSVSCIRRGEAV